MLDKDEKKEIARRIVALLPKSNCGKCGFGNCGGFAMAVAEGKASPFGCQEDPSVGYKISQMVGIKAPAEVGTGAGHFGFPEPVALSGGGIAMARGRGLGRRTGHGRRLRRGWIMGHGLGRRRGRWTL